MSEKTKPWLCLGVSFHGRPLSVRVSRGVRDNACLRASRRCALWLFLFFCVVPRDVLKSLHLDNPNHPTTHLFPTL